MSNSPKKNNENPELRLSAAQKAYLGKVDNLAKTSKVYQALLEQLRQTGKNFIRQTQRIETKKFDETFVSELEKGFDHIDRIIAHPRSFIKDESEVVEAGLAKKINAQSIVHLASHTNFVHSVDKKGNVTPERILTVHAEVDFQIYENRFVMTLMKKCSIFIEKRFQFIKDHGETRDSDVLIMKSDNTIGDARYQVESHIRVSSPSADAGDQEKNQELLDRLMVLRNRCAFYLKSPFAEELRGAKDVANPVHMTNMLLKNPDYHGAYVLWQFIDTYLDLGIQYGVKETEQEFDSQYYEELYSLFAAQILTLHTHLVAKNEVKDLKSKEKVFTPKVLFTLEDESFYNGKFLYDQFPDARGDEILGVPDVDEKMRELLQKDLEKKTADSYKKEMLEEEIENQKAKDIEQEAIERQKRIEEEARRRKEEEERLIAEEQERLEREEQERREQERISRAEERERLAALRAQIASQGRIDRANDVGSDTAESTDNLLTKEEDQKPVEESYTVIKQIVEEEDGSYVTFYDRKGNFHKFKLAAKKTDPNAAPDEADVEEQVLEEAAKTGAEPVIAPPPFKQQIVEEEDGSYVTFYDRKGGFHKFKLSDKKPEEKSQPETPKTEEKPAAPIPFKQEIVETEEGRFVTFYDRKGGFHKFRLSDKKKEAPKPEPKKKDAKPIPFKKEVVETEEGKFVTFYDRKGGFHKFKLADKDEKKGNK